jgi:hypothetical protein
MYMYEFERISSGLTGWGFSGNKYETEEYKEIINKRAADGCHFIRRS